jgi:hypothetical protein
MNRWKRIIYHHAAHVSKWPRSRSCRSHQYTLNDAFSILLYPLVLHYHLMTYHCRYRIYAPLTIVYWHSRCPWANWDTDWTKYTIILQMKSSTH